MWFLVELVPSEALGSSRLELELAMALSGGASWPSVTELSEGAWQESSMVGLHDGQSRQLEKGDAQYLSIQG